MWNLTFKNVFQSFKQTEVKEKPSDFGSECINLSGWKKSTLAG